LARDRGKIFTLLAGLCFAPWVSLPSNVSLIVASLDLQLVRLLRSAIRTADRSSQRGCACGPADCYEPRQVIHPTPRYEPRPVIHPTPRYEPRCVERPLKACPDLDLSSAPCAPPQVTHIAKSPIQPPWKTLPWENPAPPAKVVKIIVRRPDNFSKGSIIDCFI
jgi:hypothetical protein